MIKRENTNSLALPESRIRHEQRSVGANHRLQNMHLAVTHRFPNLAGTRKHELARQQRPLIFPRTKGKISTIDVIRCLVPLWDWWKFHRPLTWPNFGADVSHRLAKTERHD